MPGISEGFRAKISLFERMKSTGALSYLEESAVPIHTFLSMKFLGSMRTSFTPSSAVSSLMTVSSSEAMTVEVSSQLYTSH
jgi:hypothetical protein